MKTMIDRALKSESAPHKLVMRIFFVFVMNSLPQLEAEISIYSHERGSIFDPLLFPYLLRHKYQNVMAYFARAPYNKLYFLLLSLIVPDL